MTKLPSEFPLRRRLVLAAPFLALRPARAAETPRDALLVGALYPLTGPLAAAGNDARLAIETAAQVVNSHQELPALRLGGGHDGIPGLGGAPVRVVFADHQGDPQKARAEAERLITQEGVAALVGSFQSATAATISQVAERYEVPFVAAEPSSPSLHRRGLKWFFRPGPHDELFSQAMFAFLADVGARTGRPARTVALAYEDTIFGTDSSTVQRQLAGAAGLQVVADIRYRASSPSLAAEALRLRAANADVLLPTSYTNDAILLTRGMAEAGYKPPVVLAQATGFQDQAWLDAVGPLAEGVLSRSAYAGDAAAARPAIPAVNALFRARSGKDLNDTTSRSFTALQVLADAADRARSTAPAALREALAATDLPGQETIMPWPRVHFGEDGQNPDASPVIQQVVGGRYATVWPKEVAVRDPAWGVAGRP